MDTIIKDSLDKAISFFEYKELVSKLVASGKSSGETQSEALSNYSKLNDRRMTRLLKTLKIDDDSKAEIEKHSKSQTWLLITESWCGDAAQTMPMIHNVAELSKKIDLKVVLRDENEALMNEYLTNGNKAIPKLVVIDNDTEKVVGDWGPRPKTATKMVHDYKKLHGSLDATFKEELQKWYNKDKGKDTLDDILALIKNTSEVNTVKKAS